MKSRNQQAAPQRRFDLREELRATANRRRPLADKDSVQNQRESISQMAERLADMFSALPQDTIQGLISNLFHLDPSCSREQLADRAVAALLEMSLAQDTPQAISSFEPKSFQNSGDGSVLEVSRDLLEALDEALALLVGLPEDDLLPCVKTLGSILDNISSQPLNLKVRRLRWANERFKNDVGRHESAVGLLRLAGFEDKVDNDTNEPVLLYCNNPIESNAFRDVQAAVNGVIEEVAASATTLERIPVSAVEESNHVEAKCSPTNQARTRRDRIAEITKRRLADPVTFKRQAIARGSTNPHKVESLRASTGTATVSTVPTRRSKHITLADIEHMRVTDEIASMPSYAEDYMRERQSAPVHDYTTLLSRSYDVELIARQALDGTNKYRASKGLAPLRWHDGIARIAAQHADSMASGKAPFNHDGFAGRVALYPVVHRAAAENLALNSGVHEVAKVAVDGWIKSPGHERNLSGQYNLCGIGVARSTSGTFYLTQLFALAS